MHGPSLETSTSPRIVVLTGPTAVGKTDLAVRLVERFGGEVVSADSRQVYRYLDIGTAKPTADELRRAPHHLIDYADPAEAYSVARYRDDADAVLADLARRDRIAWIVGGSWHYIQALVDRIKPPRVPPNPELRAELERVAAEHGHEVLHARLAALDPRAAESIEPRNVRRVVRAIEVTLAVGRPFSEVGRERSTPLPAVRLVLSRPRAEVYERADARVDAMLEAGWLDEVRGLLGRGYDEALPSLSSHGYRELVAVAKGRMTLADAAQRTKWEIHSYVRRQDLWLKRQPDYHWLRADVDPLGEASRLVGAYLDQPTNFTPPVNTSPEFPRGTQRSRPESS
jgi:tRNA dimethylallyltransferase